MVLILSLNGFFLSAQDIITKNDGSEIKAKILEVNTSDLKYKRWDNLDGPTFTIEKRDVLLVKYSNGTNDVFHQQTAGRTQIKAKDQYFASDLSAIHPGMRYREYKEYYDTNDYDYLREPAYSPSRAWMNVLLPGLAQFTMGEAGVGMKYLGFSLGSTVITGLGYGLYVPNTIGGGYGQTEAVIGAGLLIVGAGLSLAVLISSMVNAGRVAKLKSLYLDDLNESNYSLTITPTIQPTYSPDGFKPAPSLALRLNF